MQKPKDARREREKVRTKAGRLFAKGIPQAEVARRCSVTRAAVSHWHAAWKEDKKKGLASKGSPGFPSRLTDKKREVFRKAVMAGPLSHGYETDLWTLSRLAAVMKKETNVKFGHNRTWQIVRELGFTCQKPQVRARERDEAAIKAWKEEAPPGAKKNGQ